MDFEVNRQGMAALEEEIQSKIDGVTKAVTGRAKGKSVDAVASDLRQSMKAIGVDLKPGADKELAKQIVDSLAD
jgi:hypothetical protein